MSRANSFLCSLTSAVKSKPKPGSIICKRATANADQHLDPHQRLRCQKTRDAQRGSERSYDLLELERAFIAALARAGSCCSHEHRLSRLHASHKTIYSRDGFRQPNNFSSRPAKSFSTRTPKRNKTAAAATAAATVDNDDAAPTYDVPRDELKQLVDDYIYSMENSVKPPPPLFQQPNIGPTLEAPFVHNKETPVQQIEHLSRLLENPETPHAEVFEAYQKLPSPRALYLDEPLLGKLLHNLTDVKRKSETSMVRYLSVIEDARFAGKKIRISHWNSALAFTGRWLARVSTSEVESVLYLWREMEEDAGIQSDQVTFNILFDIATRAGKFALAETIIKEMSARGLEHDRYLRTSLIYHYGLRGDGEGVRRSYFELVDAGDIVDSSVMTCVIASLLKCGEAVAAEHVFARMKQLHAAKSEHGDDSPAPAPSDWREERKLGRALNQASRVYARGSEGRARAQSRAYLAPKASTYHALIYYHAVTIGDVDRVTELLQEMAASGIPVQGGLFLDLLKAFSFHGGELYTSWTQRRLESLWAVYLDKVAENSNHTYLSIAAAMLAVKAYAKCTSHERTVEVWEEIQSRWPACTPEDRATIDDLFAWLYPDHYMSDPEPTSEPSSEPASDPTSDPTSEPTSKPNPGHQ